MQNLDSFEQPVGKTNRTKFIVGGIVILAAVVYLIVSSTSAGAQYFFTIDELFALEKLGAVSCAIDVTAKKLTFSWDGGSKTVPFTLAEFDEALVLSGGWVEFADAKY